MQYAGLLLGQLEILAVGLSSRSLSSRGKKCCPGNSQAATTRIPWPRPWRHYSGCCWPNSQLSKGRVAGGDLSRFVDIGFGILEVPIIMIEIGFDMAEIHPVIAFDYLSFVDIEGC